MSYFSKKVRENLKSKQAGFTITELMVVIAIVAILSGIGVPFLIKTVPYYRFKDSADEFFSDLQFCRMSAVKQGVHCTMVFNNNGYQIFADDDADQVLDAGENVLKTMTWNSRDNIQYVSRTSELNDPDETTGVTREADLASLSFRPDGIAHNDSDLSQPGGGIINLSDGSGRKTRSVWVTMAGSIRMDVNEVEP